MAKKHKFTQRELEKHLEHIEIYWHRHGDREEAALVSYIRKLYAALPPKLRELSIEEDAKRTVEIDRARMVYHLRVALLPVYSEDDIEAAVDSILLQSLAKRKDSVFFEVGLGSFGKAFASEFNSETLSAELLEGTDRALEHMLADPGVNPRRSLVAERQRANKYRG